MPTVLFKKLKMNYWKYLSWCLIFIITFYFIHDDLLSVNFSSFLNTLNTQPILRVLFFILCGLLVVSTTTLYDFILCHDFNLKINPTKIFTISWITHTAIYFAESYSETKNKLDYSFYRQAGVEPNLASFVSAIKELFLIGDTSVLPKSFNLNRFTRFKLIFAFLMKWLATVLLFHLIMITYIPDLKFIEVSSIFFISILLAQLAAIPSGLFIFEFIVFHLFTLLNVPLENLLLALVIFRIVYSFVPWILTMFILSQAGIIKREPRLSTEQRHLINHLNVLAVSTLTFFAGLLLIAIGSLPDMYIQQLAHWMIVPIKICIFGIGLFLLILSKGIWDKVQSAYYISLILLVCGAFLTFTSTTNYLNSFLLLLITFALKSTRSIFYRTGAKLSFKRFLRAFIYVLVGLCFYILGYRVITGTYFIWILGDVILNLLSLLLISSFIIMASILLCLVSTHHISFEAASNEDLAQLRNFLTQYEGNSMTHLIFLRDKTLFFCQNQQVVIAFRPYKDKLIVLGDPIGEQSYFKDALNEFRLYADQHDMTPLFYEVSEDFLPAYHENGFKFLKLGEEAIMDLREFTLIGKKYAQLRTIKNKMNRGEFVFELVQPPFSTNLLLELKMISDEWLEGRPEKEFSLGYFNEDYLNLAPIALVKSENTIIGFASIMPMYDSKYISIDLMRLIPNPPNGAMDALFVGIIEWAIAENYHYFVLGKAPLSNVGSTHFSTKKEKIVKYIYQYGNKLYSFKGLRRYKEKYHPQWKGIYLAYPSSLNLSISILQLTRMISGTEENNKS